MRLEVHASGYDNAGEALLSANGRVAVAYETLTSKLGGYLALGGDDTSSEDFVSGYDEGAAEGVNAVASLVEALGNVAVAASASGRNHRRANADSVYNRPAPSVDESAQEPETVGVFTPPTSLGGDNEDMPDWWNHVVNHLQGWGWPSANTSQLRDAAAAWRACGSTIESIEYSIDAAMGHIEVQRTQRWPQPSRH